MKDGVLVIDKPMAMTSHDVVLRAKRFFRIKKIGHVGTLDPLATGVLPLLIGEATKLSPFLTLQDKEYIATVKFGEETDTLDSEGKVVFKIDIGNFDEGRIIKVIKRFKGKMEQVPPLFSAIKKGGVPLYRLARRGLDVKIEPREIEIREIEILNLSLPYLTFRIVCSSGTYIRALCRDMGRELGWRGHLTALRRIRSGDFTLQESISLKALEESHLSSIEKEIIPIGSLLNDIPYLEVEKSIEDRIRSGWHPKGADFKDLNPSRFRMGRMVKFLSKDGRLISIAEIRGWKPSDLTFKLLRVFN